ncbi:MAG: DUF4126 family protein, partial [Gammaproteobacteria bacterium]
MAADARRGHGRSPLGLARTMTALEALLPIALGVALAAAVGLRVFLPLCALSVAGHFGWVPLAGEFAWLAS